MMTGGEFLCCLEGSTGGAARLGLRRPREPLADPHTVQRCSGGQRLQMSLGLPPRARLPQATPADALRVGTLDPYPRGILLREGVSRLPGSCGVERLVRLPGVES
jgi:hypothetical protein